MTTRLRLFLVAAVVILAVGSLRTATSALQPVVRFSNYVAQVLKIVKPGDPPTVESTKHKAALHDYEYSPGETIGRLLVDGKQLTLVDKHCPRGVVKTKELGPITLTWIEVGDDGLGIAVMLTEEQITSLEELLKP